MIGGKFAPVIIMNSEYIDMDTTITIFNTAVTETVGEILGKHCQKKKPGSIQKFLICATEGENCRRNDLNLKDLRNVRK